MDAHTTSGHTWSKYQQEPKFLSSILLSRLSGYLSEFTGNATYIEAAISSHQFIQSHFLEPNGHYVMDHVHIHLSECRFDYLIADGSAYATGLYLEALAVLSNSTGNTEMVDLSVLYHLNP